MHKATVLTISLALVASTAVRAQSRDNQRDRRPKATNDCPVAYIGFSTGFNNLNGVLGPNLDVAITPSFSVGAGVGLSTWGTKAGLEGRYYFSPNRCNKGWAVGLGFTRNSGLREAELQLTVVGGGDQTRTVLLELQPKSNLFVAGYHFFRLGRRNRFHLSAGYSMPLSETRYRNRSAYILTADSDKAVRAISPGGLIIGLGFSFGAGRMH